MTCPQCGAPLPLPEDDGFVTCGYCGVRTRFSRLSPTLPSPFTRLEPADPYVPPENDSSWEDRMPYVRIAVAIALLVIFVAIVSFAGSQTPSTSVGTTVAHCSVAINASATSGPAPFTANFSANVTTPPAVSAGEPRWQFAPFPPGLDYNFTDGWTVTHTWTTAGSYGVHVSVPDSTGQGCWDVISVQVT